ncbi:hypothetical protein [Paraburkholderia elongata]|uniref:Uncharacterized protein n=1 Tax=Paraburkholderia elongata TaxID=2675747 RepID=A0A972SJH9_9BURK|nr:hypothetical protein [Paraburkholderia elongata]NPT56428.1 hypothetical protein [Paraburkholderia elongata]NPT57134.1 hypothetical protein [Paraburkholderia elongata]
MMMKKPPRNWLKVAVLVLLGLIGFGVAGTRACEWSEEFPGMICAAGSSYAQFLSLTGVASILAAVMARRCGADEDTLTFVGAVCGAAVLFATLSTTY